MINIAVLAGLIGLGYAAYLSSYVMRQGEGTPKMIEISAAIRDGAQAFLTREFRSLGIFAAGMFLLLWIMLSFGAAFAYVFGTGLSALAAYLGMSIATRANARTAHAAVTSYAVALKTSYSSGGVMGFYVVGLGLLGLGLVWGATDNPKVWLTYAFGASSVALFLRVGGGIFTKSADVGADLVGKVEAGIPEDDPRNPATIADNVGDNVGDIAGMGSDLFESYVSAIAASMVLGIPLGMEYVKLPVYLAAVGVICSIIGTRFVQPPEVSGSFEAQAEAAHKSMNRGLYTANAAAVLSALVIVWLYVGDLNIFMEQLEQPLVRRELAQRRDGGMIEGAIGCFDQLRQLVGGKILADERPEHPLGHHLIRSALQLLQRIALEPRPGLRQIQPAIGREAGEERRLEATRRHAAAGADVAQPSTSSGQARAHW
jgi:K(+)-stimulated pyrophosphate-energized sodium pump